MNFTACESNPGDIVFGDRDGLLIIAQVVEKEAIAQALEKVAAESEVRKAISDGMSTVQAFENLRRNVRRAMNEGINHLRAGKSGAIC